jgi:ribosomal protein S27AE
MGYSTEKKFGIYLEVDVKENISNSQKYCSNVQCKKYNVKTHSDDLYCGGCGYKIHVEKLEDSEQYLSAEDIQDKIGLFEYMYNLSAYSNNKYFVFNFELEPCNYSVSDIQAIEKAKKNEKFLELTTKLEKEYGEKFKIHYGSYTTES